MYIRPVKILPPPPPTTQTVQVGLVVFRKHRPKWLVYLFIIIFIMHYFLFIIYLLHIFILDGQSQKTAFFT